MHIRILSEYHNIRKAVYQGNILLETGEKDKGCGAFNFEALGNVRLNRTD